MTDNDDLLEAIRSELGETHRSSYRADGQFIRGLMKERGEEQIGEAYTSRNLAELSGVSRRTIQRALDGESIRTVNLFALADALDVPPLEMSPDFAHIRDRKRERSDTEESCSRPEEASLDSRIADIHQAAAEEIDKLRSARTILYPDPEPITEFYYPVRLIEGAECSLVESIDDFDLTHVNGITGSAGQGKSIFLKVLAARAYDDGDCVPVFHELRDAGEAGLLDLFEKSLRSYGVAYDLTELGGLLASGHFVFFLDAFDELNIERRMPFITALKEFRAAHPAVPVVMTMRPETGHDLIHELKFRQIDTLSHRDFLPVLETLDAEEAPRIEALVEEDTVGIIGLITTPLMATLLLIHFRYSQSLPSSTVKFYEDLFDLLVRRHNRSSGLPKRIPKSGLEAPDLECFFEALCFDMFREHQTSSISFMALAALARESGEGLFSRTFSTTLALRDVIEISNLIVEDDGGTCEFVHATVVEYYAAAFLAKQTSNKKSRFYSAVSEDRKWTKWRNVLQFLETIDSSDYRAMFWYPSLQRIEIDSDEDFIANFEFVSLVTLGTDRTDEAAEWRFDLHNAKHLPIEDISPSSSAIPADNFRSLVEEGVLGSTTMRDLREGPHRYRVRVEECDRAALAPFAERYLSFGRSIVAELQAAASIADPVQSDSDRFSV